MAERRFRTMDVLGGWADDKACEGMKLIAKYIAQAVLVLQTASSSYHAECSAKRIVGLIVHVVGEKIQCMGIDHRRTIGSLFR
jgi:hypothetical protein